MAHRHTLSIKYSPKPPEALCRFDIRRYLYLQKRKENKISIVYTLLAGAAENATRRAGSGAVGEGLDRRGEEEGGRRPHRAQQTGKALGGDAKGKQTFVIINQSLGRSLSLSLSDTELFPEGLHLNLANLRMT